MEFNDTAEVSGRAVAAMAELGESLLVDTLEDDEELVVELVVEVVTEVVAEILVEVLVLVELEGDVV